MAKMFLYTHGGSFNHGCEAIVRGTVELLKNTSADKVLFSKDIQSETLYGTDKIIKICPHCSFNRPNSPKRYLAAVLSRLKLYSLSSKVAYGALLKRVRKGDIGISIGGDMYCYNNYDWIITLNNQLIAKGIRLYLWGCSIEPNALDARLVAHLKKYEMVFPRERLTEKTLLDKGLTNVLYTPDPAFLMKNEPIHDYDSYFENTDVIGINFSALISHISKNDGGEKAVKKLIDYIINKTPYSVALIPHVNSDITQNVNEMDYKYLKERFLSVYTDNDRVFLVEKKHNSPQLKYIISKCKSFVGSRTHATIAAYSQGIPTLAVGYSIKSRGIANDLFGDGEQYIVAADEIIDDEILINKFNLLVNNAEEIHNILINKISGFAPYYEAAAEVFNKNAN